MQTQNDNYRDVAFCKNSDFIKNYRNWQVDHIVRPSNSPSLSTVSQCSRGTDPAF